MPNTTEKIAGTYLRLNGFLLLPHFTTFGADSSSGNRHTHVDLIAVRLANSVEIAGGYEFPLDEALFVALGQMPGYEGQPARSRNVGIVAEVKTNSNIDVPGARVCTYVRNFFGGKLEPVRVAFFNGETIEPPHFDREKGGIKINLRHCMKWIHWRINKIDQHLQLSKTAGWNMSEEFLSDLLVLDGLMPPVALDQRRAEPTSETSENPKVGVRPSAPRRSRRSRNV